MSMRHLSTICCGVILLAGVLLFCRIGLAKETTDELLDVARKELRDAKLSEKEIQLRLKVVENVATVKAYYPHADGARPEKRNSKYWTTNEDGYFVPRKNATEAIRDLWRTESGIRCTKLSTLVMLKALIDVADKKQLVALDAMLKNKVIPDDLPDKGIGTFFEMPDPQDGKIFQQAELLAGDEVWFDNPYFDRLSRSQKQRYIGQEGHHVFYIGDGKVMDMYNREPMTIADFQETFLRWKSVKITAEEEQLEPKPEDFQIKAVRRAIVEK
jgi:hypothetical protein